MYTIVTLDCKCGAGVLGTAQDAFEAGWRATRKGPLCPVCAEKRRKQHERKSRKLYGDAAVDRANRIMREKHGL